jgi:hypothetical protein
MRRGFVFGAVAGGLLALAIGIFAAVLPSTPTWALWRIKSAIDRNDTEELSALVDIASVTQRAVTELDGSRGGLDLGQIAAAYISGGKVMTVFNDPEKPLEITGGDVFAAWWGMHRDGDLVYVTLPAGERSIDLILGDQPSRGWRIVGVTPISALLTVKPRPTRKPMVAATPPGA